MRLSTPIRSGRFIHLHRVRHPADIRQASGAPRVFFPTLAAVHRFGRLYFVQNPAGAVPKHIIDDVLFRMVEAVTDLSRHRVISQFVKSSSISNALCRVCPERASFGSDHGRQN
jgi:hypothetical protein